MTLEPHHLADLRRSGLTDETIAAATIRSVTRDEARSLLGFDPRSGGIAFPYPSRNGFPDTTHIKPDELYVGEDGKPRKYLAPKEATNRLYIPPSIPVPALQSMRVPLWITEGEKKALKAAQEGLACVALSGVWNWRFRDDVQDSRTIPDLGTIWLKGRKVLICFDSDAATNRSVRWAEYKLGEKLRELGAELCAVRLPAGPTSEKVGLDDFLVAHPVADLEALPRDPLNERPTITTSTTAGQSDPAPWPPGLVRLATVSPEPVRWLWRGYIPLGKITVMDGDPGLGKSTLALDLIARVSHGTSMPDETPCERGGAVVMTAEDGLADTIVPRLRAAGADLTVVVALESAAGPDGKPRFPTLEDLPALAEAIRRVGARLVLIDPLMAYIPGRTNSWRDQDVRSILAPLAKLAEEAGAAIVVIRHLNKAGGVQSIYRGGGSIGIVGAARSGLLVAKDPEDDAQRVLAGVKANLGPLPPSLRFHIQDAEGIARIAWDGASAHSADSLLAASAGSLEDKSALDEARDFLREALVGGAVAQKEIIKQARGAGISEITLRRAKRALGVEADKAEFVGGWLWSLPAPSGPEGDHGTPPKMIKMIIYLG